MAESIAIFTTVKLVGAVYLAYLGIQAIRYRRVEVDAGRPLPASSVRALRQGFTVGVTNPKTIVFFIAALPQFVDVGAGSVPLQLMVLGLLFTLVALLCDSAWALAAGAARSWFARSPRRLSTVRGVGGGMLIGLGGTLALARNKA